jgi:hypothetical protein
MLSMRVTSELAELMSTSFLLISTRVGGVFVSGMGAFKKLPTTGRVRTFPY